MDVSEFIFIIFVYHNLDPYLKISKKEWSTLWNYLKIVSLFILMILVDSTTIQNLCIWLVTNVMNFKTTTNNVSLKLFESYYE